MTLILLAGQIGIAARLGNQAQSGVCLCIGGVKRDGLQQIRLSPRKIIRQQACEAARGIQAGLIRPQGDGPIEIDERRVKFAQAGIDRAACDIGIGIGGIEQNRPIQVFQRPIKLLNIAIQLAAIAVGCRIIRVDLNGAAEIGQRRLILLLPCRQDTAIGIEA
jgi:hypothetical protein